VPPASCVPEAGIFAPKLSHLLRFSQLPQFLVRPPLRKLHRPLRIPIQPQSRLHATLRPTLHLACPAAWTTRRPALSRCPRIRLGKRPVRRCHRPSDHHQEYIQHEKRNRNVVEQRRLRQVRPQLIRSPEQKGNRQHRRLHKLHPWRPVRNLVHKVRNRNHGQRKCRQKIMAPGWKHPRNRIPGKQHSHARQCHHSKCHRQRPVSPVQTTVQSQFLTAPQIYSRFTGLHKGWAAGRNRPRLTMRNRGSFRPALPILATTCFGIHKGRVGLSRSPILRGS